MEDAWRGSSPPTTCQQLAELEPAGRNRESGPLGRKKFSVLNKHEVWNLHGAISIRKGRFLKLVPRLGPEGTRLSLKTCKGCEDNGARRGTDTKGTQLSAETAKG